MNRHFKENDMNARKILLWVFRIVGLTIAYIPIWILGSMAITGHLPDTPSEPGLVDGMAGMLILSVINTILDCD